MIKAKRKKIVLTLVLVFCLCMAAFGVSAHVKASAAAESENYWIVERTAPSAITGSNYLLAEITDTYENAPQLNGSEEYWGVRMKNLLSTSARIRFGFEMGGGKQCWIGPDKSEDYLVYEDGSVEKFVQNAGQYIDVPGYFDGTVYVKKSVLYNYTAQEVGDNGYRVKGVRIGYDYRASFVAKLAVIGIKVANITETEENISVTDVAFKMNLDNVGAFTSRFQGSVSADVQAQMSAAFSARKRAVTLFDNPVSMAIKTTPKTEFKVGDTADTSRDVVTVTYSDGTDSEVAEYPFNDPRFTVTGLDTSTTAEGREVKIALSEEIFATYNINVVKELIVTEPEYGWIYERTAAGAVANSNYRFMYVGVDYAHAPALDGSEEYWGIRLINLSSSAARIRFGFDTEGGNVCWIGPAGSVAYLVSDKNVQSFTQDAAQFVNVPGYFDGTVYVKKTVLYNYTKPEVATNGYTVKGAVVGYDFRLSYTAKLALLGISIADIDGETVTNDELKLNFDGVAAAEIRYFSALSDEIKTAMAENSSERKVSLSVYDTPTAIKVKTNPLTDYVLGGEADYSLGVINIEYEGGETKDFPMTDERFTISGFDSSEAADALEITVKLTDEIYTTFNVKIIDNAISADDEEGKYLLISRNDSSVSSFKTGWMYFQLAMTEWLKNGVNATGSGNCLGIRIENIGYSALGLRVELRSHNAADAEDAATHRTGMWNNANAFAWFVPDGGEEVTSVPFSKTSQVLTIPAGAAGTVYLRYDTDFSWKGHTSDYGISHVAFGIDMRTAAKVSLVVKEVFDAYYKINEDAVFTDLEDALDNPANVNTHFTTDVKIVKYARLLSTKTVNLDDVVTVGDEAPSGTISDSKHGIMILGNANFAMWTSFTSELFESELAKVSVGAYSKEDYIPVSIAVKTLPKTEYTVGELSDWLGGVITITYESGRIEDVSLIDNRLLVNGFSSIAPNESLTITVSLSSDYEINTSFTVKVNPAEYGDKASDGCKGCKSSFVGNGIIFVLAAAALIVLANGKRIKKW